MRWSILLGVVVLAGCATASDSAATTTTVPDETSTTAIEQPVSRPAPAVPEGPIAKETLDKVDRLLENVFTTDWDVNLVNDLAKTRDPRVGWLIADLLRFYQGGPDRDELVGAFVNLTGVEFVPGEVDFVWVTNDLMRWNTPAWDGYADAKSRVFGVLEPTWKQFFEDDHGVDWRLVTWGGVLADTRDLGDNGPCNCIPALDYPETTDAAGGDWYDDDRIVFGVVVGDEAIALPKNQMEVHEMVNLTLGGRELGVPYCTLCGSAQAYFVDNVEGVDRVVLRTSGLLSRSNKFMYDLSTGSAIDTFTGKALTGPLGEMGIVLDQVSVVASTWGDWKAAHPETQILARDGGIGRSYRDDPLGDRDADGPIFPIGEADDRLPVQEKVVGVITPGGTPVAFPVTTTLAALDETGEFEYEGLTVRLEDSIRLYDETGAQMVTHESFWFAWSQFHTDTKLFEG